MGIVPDSLSGKPPVIPDKHPLSYYFTDEFWQGKKSVAGIILIAVGWVLKLGGPAIGIPAAGVAGEAVSDAGYGLFTAGMYNKAQKNGWLGITPPDPNKKES
jgi:hypothetical protein